METTADLSKDLEEDHPLGSTERSEVTASSELREAFKKKTKKSLEFSKPEGGGVYPNSKLFLWIILGFF